MTLLTRIRGSSGLCREAIRLREFGRFYAADIRGIRYYDFTPFQAAVLQELGASLEFYETDRPYYHTSPAMKVKLKSAKGIESVVDEERVKRVAAILREDLSCPEYPGALE